MNLPNSEQPQGVKDLLASINANLVHHGSASQPHKATIDFDLLAQSIANTAQVIQHTSEEAQVCRRQFTNLQNYVQKKLDVVLLEAQLQPKDEPQKPRKKI